MIRLSDEQMHVLMAFVEASIDLKIDQNLGRSCGDSSLMFHEYMKQLKDVLQQGYGDDE